MVVANYGVWRAKPVRYTYQTPDEDPVSPHLTLYFTDDEDGQGTAAINIKSGDRHESRLVYWAVPQFVHPITDQLAALDEGFRLLAGTPEQGPGGLALDFIRGNLFRRSSGRILPQDVPGPDNDILDELKPIFDRAIAEEATVYIYGSHFDGGKGIHDVHMNQGNAQRWAGDNGVYQDGAVILQFDDHWEAVFIGFASQAVHTEDGPDNAGQPIPRHGYLTWADFLSPEVAHAARVRADLADSPVLITEVHVNPPETVTLTDRGNQGVDLSGWSIVNKSGEAQILTPGLRIDAGGSLLVEVPDAPLSARGGTITLLNAQGLKVHGVSYAKRQVQDGTCFFT
jgi:uncharacterized protein YukJ